MRRKSFQNRVTAGRWTLPAVIFICTLCWALTSFLLPELIPLTGEENVSPLWQAARAWVVPGWIERIVSYLIYAIIGYLLIEINNRFSIIRMRASVQTAIYFLFITVCPEMHLLYVGDVVAFACLMSLFFLFKTYQQAEAAADLYYCFFFIGAGSILFPQLTFLSVFLLVKAHRFRSLTLRSFCGALLGWSVPYLLLLSYAFLYDRMELFYYPFAQLVSFEAFFRLEDMQPWELATLGYLLVLFIVSTAHAIIAGFEDKIRTRAYLQCLIGFTFWVFLFIALQPAHGRELLPLLMTSNSFLTGHLFVLTNSRTSNVFFIISLTGLILLFGFNLWALL